MNRSTLLAFTLLLAPLGHAADCDITQQPAATLLLPYFVVGFIGTTSHPVTTQYTVINTGPAPAIARTTIWTDHGYPVLAFNTFLTGYAAQTIDLSDVLLRGSTGATSSTSAVGARSLPNDANPYFSWGAATDCASPEPLTSAALAEANDVLTFGFVAGICNRERVGNVHANLIGYATIDVVSSCRPSLPSDASYFTQDLLYDNVLTGDYVQIEQGQSFASSLVHIRAVPEGGGPANLASPLGASFYESYTPAGYAKTMDRRQPLPSRFAAPLRDTGTYGEVSLVIWREGVRGADSCSSFVDDGFIPLMDPGAFVRFDEHENATTERQICVIGDCPPFRLVLPVTSELTSNDFVIPAAASTDLAGWMYFDLNNPESGLDRPTQNWVVVRRRVPGDARSIDATALANGCRR